MSPTDRPEPLPGGDDLGVVEAVRAVDAAEAGVADAADLSWRNSQLFSDTGLQGRGPPASALPTEGTDMTTAIIGVGNIGATVARQLAAGGENLLIASQSKETADTLAAELGSNVSSTTVDDAIARSDSVILAVWFNVLKDIVSSHAAELVGKVIIDPSNNLKPDAEGNFVSANPEGVSAGEQIAAALPTTAKYVKAFGALPAELLTSASGRTPERAVLFYATDDDEAAATAERLITAAGFAPVKAGGVADTRRIEVFGDLHAMGGLDGRLLTVAEARAKI